MHQSEKDVSLAIAAMKVIIDGRNPQAEFASIMVTAEHAVAALLILLTHDPRKAAAMLNEGFLQGVEARLALYNARKE